MNSLLLALIIPAGPFLLTLSALVFFRWGYRAFTGTVPLLIGLVLATASSHEVFNYLVTALILGSFAGLLFRGGRSVQFFIIGASLTAALLSYADYQYINRVKKIDIIELNKTQALQIIDAKPGSSAAEKDASREFLVSALSVIKIVLPFYYLITNIIWASIIYLFLKFMFKRQIISKGIIIRGIEKFRVNDYLIFVLIASAVVYLFAGAKNKIANAASLNSLLILGLLYLLQAYGVLKHFLIKKNIPTVFLPMILILIIMIGRVKAIVFLSVFLAGFGALDLWANFRKIGLPDAPSDGNI